MAPQSQNNVQKAADINVTCVTGALAGRETEGECDHSSSILSLMQIAGSTSTLSTRSDSSARSTIAITSAPIEEISTDISSRIPVKGHILAQSQAAAKASLEMMPAHATKRSSIQNRRARNPRISDAAIHTYALLLDSVDHKSGITITLQVVDRQWSQNNVDLKMAVYIKIFCCARIILPPVQNRHFDSRYWALVQEPHPGPMRWELVGCCRAMLSRDLGMIDLGLNLMMMIYHTYRSEGSPPAIVFLDNGRFLLEACDHWLQWYGRGRRPDIACHACEMPTHTWRYLKKIRAWWRSSTRLKDKCYLPDQTAIS